MNQMRSITLMIRTRGEVIQRVTMMKLLDNHPSRLVVRNPVRKERASQLRNRRRIRRSQQESITAIKVTLAGRRRVIKASDR